MKPTEQSLIVGINPVREALLASKRCCYRLIVEQGKAPPRVQAVIELAEKNQIPIEPLPKSAFQSKFKNQVHQGIAGYFSNVKSLELEELIETAFQQSSLPTLVILDGIQDPQNLGAIIRSAETLGIQGMILPKHGTASLNETVAKCSSGAIEHLPIAWVINLARSMEKLKEAGVPVSIATDVGGGTSLSMLTTLGEAYKVCQMQGYSLHPLEAFYMMTLGNAKATHLDHCIGNFERGKEAQRPR